MHGSYRPVLVALSVAIAIVASYVALRLAGRVAAAAGRARAWWVAGGGVAMGVGIWSMHFVGMLAFRLHAGPAPPAGAVGDRARDVGAVPMAYDGPLLLLSVAVAVAASALALGVVGRRASAGASTRALVGAGLAMGAAIAGMHYLGMAGLRVPAALTHRPALVVASVGIAVGASFAALGLAFRLRNDDVHRNAAGAARRSGGRRLGAAAVMGAAIVGMHYTAMAAAHFTPRATGSGAGSGAPGAPGGAGGSLLAARGAVLATDGLAGVVTAATALVLGLALLGTVVDRRVAERLRVAREHERLYREAETARAEAEAARRDAEARTREAEQLAGELQERATELEQQTEEAQALAAELEAANEALQVASAELEAQTEAAERARAEADAARARLTQVFEQAPVAVVVVRGRVAPDLVFELVNPRYLEMLPPGRDPRGRRVRDVLPEMGPELLGALQGVLDTGVPFLASDFVMPLDRDGDGAPEDYYFSFVYHPLVEADGMVGGVVGIGTEVTDSVRARQRAERLQHAAEAERERAEAERERAEAERERAEAEREHAEAARAAAETANRARADFLASMSHELRTPLNAIGGYAQLLEMGLHGAVTDAQRGALGRVQKAQTHLLGLINDVLNFAKLEAGRVEFDVRATSVADVVREVMPLVEPQLRAKGLRCAVALPGTSGADDSARGNGPVLVWADAEKLGQVLLNLLSNAVKFTPPTQGEGAPEPGAPGRVTLALAGGPARAGEEDGDGTVVRLLVRDTGVGISVEKQAVIFDAFVQVSTGLTRTSEGTGLGLAISRDLARGMGGDLTVESTPGAGSTFTLTLPAASSTAA